MLLVLALTLWTAAEPPAEEAESPFFALTGAAVGVTWDSNVTRSPSPESDFAIDASATGGAGWAVSEHWVLSAMALYRGRTWASDAALSTHVLGAVGLAAFSPLDWLTLGLAPLGGYTLAADPARWGPRFDARGFVQVRPVEWLRLKAGYGYLMREAADPFYALRAHELALRLRLRPARWVELSLAGALMLSTDTLYREVAEETRVLLRPRCEETIFEEVKVDARTYTVAATVEFLLPAGFSVLAEVAWVANDNAVQPWNSWMPAVEVAWDLP